MGKFFTVVALLMLAFVAEAKLFVPDSEYWSVWDAADNTNLAVIDHDEWQALLDAFLITDTADAIYRVDYAAVTVADRKRLQAYITALASLDPRQYSKAEQKAYWINLYNALTVELVLAHSPVESIRKIYGGLFSSGPWKKQLVTVAGLALSLNDIEHRILRPLWADPRIHYAVNCASLGCPNLAASAYTAVNSEKLLDESARAYVNHPRGVGFESGQLTASSIYDWFDVDFGDDEQALRRHWLRYAEPALARQIRAYRGRIRYTYDWTLNAP